MSADRSMSSDACEGLDSHAADESPMHMGIIPTKNPSKSFLARVLGLAEHRYHPHDCYGVGSRAEHVVHPFAIAQFQHGGRLPKANGCLCSPTE